MSSSPESITDSPLQTPAAKPKAKRNISDEERARRSDRMKEISAKRIADIKSKKEPAPVPEVAIEPVILEPPKVTKTKQPKPESDDEDDDDDIVEKIIKRLASKSKSKKQSKVRAPEPESESEDEDIVKPKKSAAKQQPKTKATPRPRVQAREASPPPPPPAPAAPQKRPVIFF
jgi:hypothetical protein